MELYEIIKSNEFLISVYAVLILLISFILFKIRNQAKKKRVTNFKSSKPENGLNHSKEENEILLKTKEIGSNSRSYSSTKMVERYKKKFNVLNKPPRVDYFSNTNFKRNPRFSEYYEGTMSRLMFKFKPKNSIEE